jgi:hypothetical protein
MTAAGLTSTEIGYVKIWSSDYPKVRGVAKISTHLLTSIVGTSDLRIVDSASIAVRHPE